MNTSNNKKIAIIGSGEMAVIIVENAKKMGIETHSFSNDLNDRVVGMSDEHHNISIFDTERIVEECKRIGIDGVLPTTELTIHIAAIVSEALSLPGMPIDISEKITDKDFVREKAKAVKNLYQPQYCVCSIGDHIPEDVSYPVVVKPTSLGGKRGVSVANNNDELKMAIEYAVESMPESKNRLIIEEYIDGGKEYSVESISSHGKHMVIQVTEKISSGPPHCVELGHMQPAEISKDVRLKIDRIIPELLGTVGVDNSTSHTEIKIVNEQIYLIELNARSGGDHIAYPLTELSTGYPYIQGAINVAMDSFEFPTHDSFKDNYCGVIFVVEQTKRFKPLYDECEKYEWLYKKNNMTKISKKIVNNQAFDTNYFIYKSKKSIPTEIKKVLF